jgi:hypothetical protein
MAAGGTRSMSVVISMVMGARRCDGAAWRCLATRGAWVVPRGVNTLRRAAGGCGGSAAKLGQLLAEAAKRATSADTSELRTDLRPIYRRSQGGVSEKIIGRTGAIDVLAVGAGRGIACIRGALALGDEPARYGSRGVFFEPLIHQRSDLLAEVGGVTKARQLVTLQAVARSSKQELPGGLGMVTGHGNPPVGTGGTG